MTDVIKSSGGKEPFNAEKVRASIKKAVIDAGKSVLEKKELIEKVSSEVVQAVNKKAEISSKEIKEAILSRLDKLDSAVSSAWRRFDKKYKS